MAIQRDIIPVRDGIKLRLFELRHPNLGTYSPTKLEVISSAADVIAALEKNPAQLKDIAMIEAPFDVKLQKAQLAKFSYVKNGATLVAQSRGQSAILLPLQYSHCLVASASGPGSLIAVMRANLLHTLVVFSGSVKINLRWDFGFFGDQSCRAKDVEELKHLKLEHAFRNIADAVRR